MTRLMPNADDIEFKQKFIDRYSTLTDWDEFRKYCLSFPRKSIRVNTLKIGVNDVVSRLSGEWDLMQVPWCKEGFWIEHKGKETEDGEIHKRRDVGNLKEHVLGYIYIQEAASMIPPIVLNPRPDEHILDMCASPGSKASQMAAMMESKGVLVANDYKGDRLAPLGLNMQRVGATNAVLTLMTGHHFKDKVPEVFDRILVDAPCSGTGTIRKSIKTITIWNPNMVKRLSATQKKLMESAYLALKPGGTMVYSTCTLEPEEDEGNISFMLDKYPDLKTEKIELDIRRSQPVMSFEGKEYNSGVKNCLRLWPQDNDTEGFFVTRLKKGK